MSKIFQNKIILLEIHDWIRPTRYLLPDVQPILNNILCPKFCQAHVQWKLELVLCLIKS